MKSEVMKIIEKVYVKKNYEFFVNKCKTTIKLPDAITSFLKGNGFDILEFHENLEASKKWCIKFKEFQLGEFKVSYCTTIEISKIERLFYIQHEFSVPNMDDKKIEPLLEGFGSHPYTTEQASVYDKIIVELIKLGYLELSYKEMNEVVNLDFEKKLESIYGEQPTIEGLIFHDIMDINMK